MQPSPTRARRAAARAGFTLIEIMVVIAILGLLAFVVAPNVYNKLREAKVTTTKTRMQQLALGSLQDYKRHYSRLPESLEELLNESDKNLGEPYAKPADLKDSWGGELQYTRLSNTKFKLVSLGADGLEGGEFDEQDITYPDDFEDMP